MTTIWVWKVFPVPRQSSVVLKCAACWFRDALASSLTAEAETDALILGATGHIDGAGLRLPALLPSIHRLVVNAVVSCLIDCSPVGQSVVWSLLTVAGGWSRTSWCRLFTGGSSRSGTVVFAWWIFQLMPGSISQFGCNCLFYQWHYRYICYSALHISSLLPSVCIMYCYV